MFFIYVFRAASLPAQAPESEAQATVRVQTDGDLSGGVELTLQFYGATQGTGGSVRHLEEIEYTEDTFNALKRNFIVNFIKNTLKGTIL